MELVAKYKGIVGADILLAKALMMSEVSQMSKAEIRMREFLLSSWTKLQKEAVKKATQLAIKLESPEKISKEIENILDPWVEQVAPVVSSEMRRIFELALQVGHKKATQQTKGNLNYDLPKTTEVKKAVDAKVVVELLPSFSLSDEQAIEALKDDQIFWIGERYGEVTPRIKAVVKEAMLESGGSSYLAGKLIKQKVDVELAFVKVPGGFVGTREQYYEALAANAATNARVHGQMRSFMAVGVQTYQISAINDKRTCERCSHMHGKVFQTTQGADQMANVLEAKTPEAVKRAHPWKSHKQIKELSSKPGPLKGNDGRADSKKLADAGLAFPPYHFKCRCTVDISEDIGSYNQLTPMDPPAVKPRPKPPAKPKKKPEPKKKPKEKKPKEKEPEGLTEEQKWINEQMKGQKGFVSTVAIDDQLDYRINQEMESLQKALEDKLEQVREKKLTMLKKMYPDGKWEKHLGTIPRRLTVEQKGEAIRDVFEKEIKVTKGRKYKSIDVDSSLGFATRKSAKEKALKNYGQGVELLPDKQMQAAHEMGMQYVDDRVYNKVKNKMPFVFRTVDDEAGEIAGGFHSRAHSYRSKKKMNSMVVIQNHKESVLDREFTQVVKHEYGHFLDTVGANGRVSVAARNKFATSGRLTWVGDTLDDGYFQMEGRWGQGYCGRVYGSDIRDDIRIMTGQGELFGGSEIASEFGSTAAELLEPDKTGRYKKLGLEMTLYPERIAFLKAFLKGKFI